MKAYEVAFRLGKFPSEVMAMPFHELLDIIEYDQCAYDENWIRHAIICAKMDGQNWQRGRPKPNPDDYLPKVKTTRKPRTRAEKIAAINARFGEVSKQETNG